MCVCVCVCVCCLSLVQAQRYLKFSYYHLNGRSFAIWDTRGIGGWCVPFDANSLIDSMEDRRSVVLSHPRIVIGSANRNADPLSPRVLSPGHVFVRNLSYEGLLTNQRTSSPAEESTAPNVRNPSCPPKRADPNYSQLPACSRCRFVFPRAPGGYVSPPSLHAGLHEHQGQSSESVLGRLGPGLIRPDRPRTDPSERPHA